VCFRHTRSEWARETGVQIYLESRGHKAKETKETDNHKNMKTHEKTGKPILDALIDASESFADEKASGTPQCEHKDREWRGPNWTCVECGDVKRQADIELDGVKFKITPAQPSSEAKQNMKTPKTTETGVPGQNVWHFPAATSQPQSPLPDSSTKKQWQELADEAISDAGYWKREARKAQARVCHAERLAEELAIAKSQIENHDATLEQVRLNERHKAKRLAEALREISNWALQNYEPGVKRLADNALAEYEKAQQ
jgi:hypothetical protein